MELTSHSQAGQLSSPRRRLAHIVPALFVLLALLLAATHVAASVGDGAQLTKKIACNADQVDASTNGCTVGPAELKGALQALEDFQSPLMWIGIGAFPLVLIAGWVMMLSSGGRKGGSWVATALLVTVALASTPGIAA